MKSKLIAHLKSDEDKRAFERKLHGSKEAFDRIRTILNEWDKEVENQDLNPGEMYNPNWPYKQAFNNGQRNMIRRLYSLVDVESTPK